MVGLTAIPDAARPLADLIARRAAERGGAAFVVDARAATSVSYSELAVRVDAWRERFAGAGLGAGARVGLAVASPLTFTTVYLAAMAAGLWVAPVDPTMPTTNPAAFAARAARLGLCAQVDDVDGGAALRHRSDGPPAGDGDGGVVMASSGTTGAPKVMRLTTRQLLAAGALVADHSGLTEADHGFNPLPLFHINAQVVGLMATLQAGATISLDDRFHRTDFWARIGRAGVTWVNAVPAIIARLVPLTEGESVPAGVRFVRSASAPLAARLMESFESETGLPVLESYGMTEAASQICANPLGARRPGSVGVPVGVRVRITNARGPVPAGGVGDVEISGPTVIEGYDGPGYEDRFTPDHWLRTGDVGYLDVDGYLHLAGRSDDVINRGGEKIYPREIEDVLVHVPEVAAAAVVGQDDPVFGQVPVAYVALRGDANGEDLAMTLKALREALVAAFPRTRRPATLRVVAALPAGPTGKVRTAELRRRPPAALAEEPVA